MSMRNNARSRVGRGRTNFRWGCANRSTVAQRITAWRTELPLPKPHQDDGLLDPPYAFRRRGVVIIVVMVCFLLAGVLFAALARIAVAERQTDRLRHWKAQAAWLTEAAMERAVAKLRANPNYAGETWTISLEELSGRRGAAVRIVIEPVVDQTDRCRIKVEADFPNDPRNRCRLKKEIVVERDDGDNPFKVEEQEDEKDKSTESKEENK